MSEKDGGPAFPVPHYTDSSGDSWEAENQGISKLEWLAGKALPAVIAHYSCGGTELISRSYDEITEEACRIAESMLKRLERRES